MLPSALLTASASQLAEFSELNLHGLLPCCVRFAPTSHPVNGNTRFRSVCSTVTEVGIEPRRAHHVIADKVTFPRAPLQSRKVGFPDSGFDLGFPRKAFPRRVKLKRSLAIHPNPFWFTSQLVLKIMAPPTCVVDHARTAKCPELLCPSQALLMTGWRLAPPRRALPLLPRSYELMRQTSSLLWNSCIHTYLPRSLQVAANPCWKPVLPDVISASLSQDA
jgi:hypothetical protein